MADDQSRRGRGRPKTEAPKVAISLRIDRATVDAFKAGGPGWQSRMNDALRMAAAAQPEKPERPRQTGKSAFDPNFPYLGGDYTHDAPDVDFIFDDDLRMVPKSLHPAALLVPLMTKAEREELGNSIVRHGLLEPIIVDKTGRVIDGRHRLLHFQQTMGKTVAEIRKMKRADGGPAVVVFEGTDADILKFVMQRNVIRRHVPDAQKRKIMRELATRFDRLSHVNP